MNYVTISYHFGDLKNVYTHRKKLIKKRYDISIKIKTQSVGEREKNINHMYHKSQTSIQNTERIHPRHSDVKPNKSLKRMN